jgi:N-glycosylase/DNA lyase
MTINLNRVRSLSQAIGIQGVENIIKFDYSKPEFRLFKDIYSLEKTSPNYLFLTAMLTGFLSYEVADREKYWGTLRQLVIKTGKIDSTQSLRVLIDTFLEQRIDIPHREKKLAHLKDIFTSAFPKWFISNYEYILANPIEAWAELGNILNMKTDSEILYLSIRAIDITNLIIRGDYLPFPEDSPIPIDKKIRNMTLSSGLTDSYNNDDEIRDAWSRVGIKATLILGINMNPLVIHDIVHDIGTIVHRNLYNKEKAERVLEKHLVETLGMPTWNAHRLIDEFLKYINRVEL